MLSWDEGKDLSSSSCGLPKNNPHDAQLLYKPPDSCSDEYSSSNDSKIAKATRCAGTRAPCEMSAGSPFWLR